MSGISGFSNQKKIGPAQFQSVLPVGSNRNGSPTPQLYLTELTASIGITDVIVSDDQKKVYLEIVSHSSRIGDVLRFVDGNLIAWEFDICEVVDANTLAIWNVGEDDSGDNVIPLVGDLVKTYRWVTATSSPDGALTVSPGPVKFVNGGEQTVTPNTPLPTVNTIGVLDTASLDMAANPLDSSTWVEIKPSVGFELRKIQVFLPSGEAVQLGYGAAGLEEVIGIIFPGGGEVDLRGLASGDRLVVKTVKAGSTITSGDMYLNLLG